MDGVRVGYFEYNGTSDFAMPRIYRTMDEVEANWRDRLGLQPRDDEPICSCEKTSVTLLSHYGGGFDWRSEACLEHMRITGQLEEHPYGENDDWVPPWRT